MKKLLTFTTILLGSLIILAVTLNYLPSEKEASPLENLPAYATGETPISPDITLSLTPLKKTVKNGQQFTISVQAASSVEMLALDLYITYSTDKIRVLSVRPGNYFTDPSILAKKIDDTDGIVSYSLASLTPERKEGTVAILTLQATNPGTAALSIRNTTLPSMKGAVKGKILLDESAVITIQ